MSFVLRQGDAISPHIGEKISFRTHPNANSPSTSSFTSSSSSSSSTSSPSISSSSFEPLLPSLRPAEALRTVIGKRANRAHLPKLTKSQSFSLQSVHCSFLLVVFAWRKASNSLYSLEDYVCHYGKNTKFRFWCIQSSFGRCLHRITCFFSPFFSLLGCFFFIFLDIYVEGKS